MGTFGTTVNPAHFVEAPDPGNVAGQPARMVRPPAGTTLSVQNPTGGGTLTPITTGLYGYWTAAYAGVDAILVSADGGVTWVGPLLSIESSQAGAAAGGAAADAATAAASAGTAAATADTKAQTALNQIAAGGGGGSGPVASTSITDATPLGRAVLTASTQAVVLAAIGAGTSSLIVGPLPSNAKAGDYKPPMVDIPAGIVITTPGTTRPTTRTDLTVRFTGADPGANAFDGDEWRRS